MSGPNSGGDLFDMAKDGTSVPDDAARPRYIPSKPGPGDIPTESDPNDLGADNLAGAATNATDIPRTTTDRAGSEVITASGEILPSQVGSKRLHAVPAGVVQEPGAKGHTRDQAHGKEPSKFEADASDGAQVERAPGQEEMSDEQVKAQFERKEV